MGRFDTTYDGWWGQEVGNRFINFFRHLPSPKREHGRKKITPNPTYDNDKPRRCLYLQGVSYFNVNYVLDNRKWKTTNSEFNQVCNKFLKTCFIEKKQSQIHNKDNEIQKTLQWKGDFWESYYQFKPAPAIDKIKIHLSYYTFLWKTNLYCSRKCPCFVQSQTS